MLKYFFKVFSIAFICFLLAIGAGVYTYSKIYVAPEEEIDLTDEENKDEDNIPNEEELKDPLQKAIASSKRVNFLLMGMEGTRSDTIIFASFDPKIKKVDMISIPRDTYYYTKGYEDADLRKINAVYGRKKAEGTKKAVEETLGQVPVHHYITIDYKGVEKIVDSIGGVEVNVPFHMEYKDTTAGQPPLYIDIPKGKRVLNGEDSVKFLRFRHNNDMTVGYPDGDLGRIKAQQQFMKSAIKKSLSLKLINVVKTSLDHVKTDIKISEALGYATGVIGFDMDDLSMTTLPGAEEKRTYGKQRLSYFIHDPVKIKELMMEIYDVQEENTEEGEKSSQ